MSQCTHLENKMHNDFFFFFFFLLVVVSWDLKKTLALDMMGVRNVL